MTLMELLGMERLQLQASRELEALRQETRAAQVRRQWAFDLANSTSILRLEHRAVESE